jgi:hypothetical protein
LWFLRVKKTLSLRIERVVASAEIVADLFFSFNPKRF